MHSNNGSLQERSEEDKGEKGPDDSAADSEVKAIEEKEGGEDGIGNGDSGGNNNEDNFDLAHQQQQQESSTPTPDARSGTAGSRKLQPASMQPTLMEVRARYTIRRAEELYGTPGDSRLNFSKKIWDKTNL